MKILYNEIDGFAADWIENLMAAGEITPGKVDRRTIHDLRGADVDGFTRFHAFAGIGGWDLALHLAGWTAERPVWTGSCPCQPFSSAGRKQGVSDPRHLWPEFFRLIRESKPPTVFGEQVASKDGLAWLDGVQTDLEGEDYAFAAVDLCAASINAAHQRQRLFWVANAGCLGNQRWGKRSKILRSKGEAENFGTEREWGWHTARNDGEAGGLAFSEGQQLHRGGDAGRWWGKPPDNNRMVYTNGLQHEGIGRTGEGGREPEDGADESSVRSVTERCGTMRLGEPSRQGLEERQGPEDGRGAIRHQGPSLAAPSPWDVIPRRDPRAGIVWCRVEPGSFPLAYGFPAGLGRRKSELGRLVKRATKNRNGRIKGYGNAINPFVAAEFIAAFLEAEANP